MLCDVDWHLIRTCHRHTKTPARTRSNLRMMTHCTRFTHCTHMLTRATPLSLSLSLPLARSLARLLSGFFFLTGRPPCRYRELYFEGGVSSAYLWDLDHGFAGVVLIKKIGDGSKQVKGCWDSIHVVEVKEHSKSPVKPKEPDGTLLPPLLPLRCFPSADSFLDTVLDPPPHIASRGSLSAGAGACMLTCARS